MIRAALAHALLLAPVAWLGGARLAPGVIGLLVAWQLLETRVVPDRPDTADRITRVAGVLVLLVVGSALALPGTGTAWGFVLMAAGVGLRLWAITTLGPLFLDGVARLVVHERVTTGPYRWLAHPGALGTVLVLAGVVAALGSVVAAAVLVGGWVPVTLRRLHAEDRLFEVDHAGRSRPASTSSTHVARAPQ